MTVEILEGQSKRLYSLVAPLVMDRKVLRQNNHYPFWTSPSHVWFVALNSRRVEAFIPVEVNGRNEAKINNYYWGRASRSEIQELIEAVISYCDKKYALSAVVLMQHRDLFEDAGFQISKEWKLYVKMEHVQGKRAIKTINEKKAKRIEAAKKVVDAKKAAKKAARKTAKKAAPKAAPKAAAKKKATKKAAPKTAARTAKVAKTAKKKVAKRG